MPASIVVAVRKAVVAGLTTALAGESSVSVSYGWLGGDETRRREQIYTNRVRGTHEPAALKAGRNFRNEQMDFDLCLFVADPTKAPEDVDTRVMELAVVVEEYLADRKSNELGVTGLNWIHVTGFELENRLMTTGAASLAVWKVSYNARLT